MLKDIYKKVQLKQLFQRHLEDSIKFVVAGVILALEELHHFNLVCRCVDENSIAIRANGYPCLINMSMLASEGHQGVSVQSSPYLCLQQYKKGFLTRGVDFWRLGILIYYMICDQYPNFSLYKEKSFQNAKISSSLSDLVNQLILYDPNKRLGTSNISQLKNHPFFYNFQWQKYKRLQLKSPFLQYFQPLSQQKRQHKYLYSIQCKKGSFLSQFDQLLTTYISCISKQRLQKDKKDEILQSSMNESKDSDDSSFKKRKEYNFHLYDKQYYCLD